MASTQTYHAQNVSDVITPSPGDVKEFLDISDSHLKQIDSSRTVIDLAGGGGDPQTPWFSDIDADGFTINNLDVLGIGTNSPTAPLEIFGSAGAVARFTNNGVSGSWISINATGTGGHEWIVQASANSSGEGPGRFVVNDQTASATRLVIDSSGNLGLGTVDPQGLLDVAGEMFLSSGFNTKNYIDFSDGENADVSSSNHGRLKFNSDNEWFEISENGGDWIRLQTLQTPWQSDIDGNGFNLTSVANTQVNTRVNVPLVQPATAINLFLISGDGGGGNPAGNVVVDSGTDGGDGTGQLNIGISNAAAVNIGKSSNTIGFYGTGPTGQATTGISPAAFTANTSGIVDDSATFGGYTIGQVVSALKAIGILA